MLAVLASAAVACRDRAPPASPDGVAARVHAPAPDEPQPHQRELDALRAFEQKRRTATDFATLPPSEQVLGPEPYRIAALHRSDRLVGLLRNESAVVVLDRDGSELARAPAPRSPSGLAISAEDDVLVVGEAAREIAVYRVALTVAGTSAGTSAGPAAGPGGEGKLARVASLPVDALGLRDVALAPDARTAYVVEEHTGRLLAVSLARAAGERLAATGVHELARCHGPYQVAALAGAVAVDCVLDHAIEIHRDGGELARIHHDGPIWSFAVHRERDGGILVAAGGVEDHPLEREDGGFGYIDSFVYLYRLAPGAAQPVRLAAVNTSALGVVTPKWIELRAAEAGALSLTVAGYASASLLTLTWRGGDFTADPQVEQTQLLPGTSAAARTLGGPLVAADPLLDAWVVQRGGEPRLVPVASALPTRSALSRVGELLFFTTLMAPWNSSDGKLSRFTCETCHHEGYVDGRTHFTGRGNVFATTRPLYGLFNNRPHFSRAFDRTMTQMVHAEFRVANSHNGRDPWFALTRADVPWLDRIPDAPAQLSPEILREAFMTFLMDFSHRANPAAIDHSRFTDLERTGARVFRDRCAVCHAARLIADEPASLVPFERWESLVLSPSGPIVWSNAAYQKTGVEPYVHAEGARVPTLRRLYKKWPYFTSGRARSLDDVLDRFASSGTVTYHDASPADAALTRLTADDKRALRAFLDLL
jgi:cytochrome c peroxidase